MFLDVHGEEIDAGLGTKLQSAITDLEKDLEVDDSCLEEQQPQPAAAEPPQQQLQPEPQQLPAVEKSLFESAGMKKSVKFDASSFSKHDSEAAGGVKLRMPHEFKGKSRYNISWNLRACLHGALSTCIENIQVTIIV